MISSFPFKVSEKERKSLSHLVKVGWRLEPGEVNEIEVDVSFAWVTAAVGTLNNISCHRESFICLLFSHLLKECDDRSRRVNRTLSNPNVTVLHPRIPSASPGSATGCGSPHWSSSSFLSSRTLHLATSSLSLSPHLPLEALTPQW